jgi:tetratricopeptide (TPR) repeat protein
MDAMRPMTARCVVTIATAAAIWAMPARGFAQSAPGSRVLVMPFTVQADPAVPGGAGASFWIGDAAAILIGDRLREIGLDPLSRDERVAAFDRLELPQSSTLTRATTIRIGELVGASEVVVGEARLGQKLSVRARVISLNTARQLPDVADEAALSDIFQLFDRVGLALGRATGRAVSVPASASARPPLDAFENYVKGLVAVAPAAQARFLEAALRQTPRDARVLTALWSVYAEQGQHDKALAAARNVPAESPLSRRARYAASLSLIELGRFDEASKELTTLNTERPSAAVWNALGVVELRKGGAAPGDASYYFTRAEQLSPEDTDLLFNLGYAYALAHDAQAALYWLREVVRFDAVHGDAHLVMSAVLESMGKSVEAQRELDLAKLLGSRSDISTATLTPKVATGLERIPDTLDMTADVRLNAAIASPAQREQQEVARFQLDQARRLIEDMKDREAVNALRRAIYLSPYQDEPHLLLGRVYQRGGRLPEAIDEFKVAIWCHETIDARLALASALFDSGDKVGARREAERALQLKPDSVDARTLLDKIAG